MKSERLHYRELKPTDLGSFHRLVRDDHVRRYLLDGESLPREWSEECIEKSRSLFERRGVGTWLVHDQATGELVGFCGFHEFPETHPQPQLIYALFEKFSGQGYATEMARAAIAAARMRPGFRKIIASVDEVNAASLQVLVKVGFVPDSVQQGRFGNLLVMRLGS